MPANFSIQHWSQDFAGVATSRDSSSVSSLVILHEAAFESAVDELVIQCERELFEMNQVQRMGQDIARMAATESPARLTVMPIDEPVHQPWRAGDLLLLAKSLKDVLEFVLPRAVQKQLVLNAPKKRLIPDVRRVQVGGEHQERLEVTVILPPVKSS